ncbi:hypothetical protein LTR53_012679 [Teratosphaeriaceae sp. CCFEE 6253]|nr:hypothetical protein LTR53_012679 [Teratosphaeriaceae sp. CCFEE 6253]
MRNEMLNTVLAGCGLAFLVCSVALLIINKRQRQIVLARFRLRRSRTSGSLTPPRSLSPEKPGLSPVETSSTPDFSDVFPPSRRHVLKDLPPNALRGPGESAEVLSAQAPDYSRLVPSCEVVNTTTCPDHVTATGFTVSEIQRLGDFPDYAALSGIPLPDPYHGFDINKAIPRPYRPFRWAYHQTMSLTKLEPDWWLELEQTYVDRIRQREGLFEEFGPMMLQSLPGAELATKELMEMCLQFLCARHPQYFRLDVENMVFHNSILGTTTDLRATELLEVLLHNIPEDFAIMLRDPKTGIYSFRAGIICSSLGWNLGSKIGLKLSEIHAPIPDYKEKMQFSMDRYFSKKPTEKAIQRGSWGLEIDEPLFMPPNDPHEKLREAQDPTHTVDRCHLRVDWQTLRRLPLSGAVVFNFKAVFTPVMEFRDEPHIPALILKVLKEGKKSLMEYKNTWHTEHVVIPALEEYQREQVATGIVEEAWEPHTLDESPFYPGWEAKWHRRQGF